MAVSEMLWDPGANEAPVTWSQVPLGLRSPAFPRVAGKWRRLGGQTSGQLFTPLPTQGTPRSRRWGGGGLAWAPAPVGEGGVSREIGSSGRRSAPAPPSPTRLLPESLAVLAAP